MQGTFIVPIANLSIVHIKGTCPTCMLATCQFCCEIWWCPQEQDFTHPSSIFQFLRKSNAMQGTFIVPIANLSIVHIKGTCPTCMLATCQFCCEIWWCPQEQDFTHPSSIFQFLRKSNAMQGTFILPIANLSIVHIKGTCPNCMLATCQFCCKIWWCPQEQDFTQPSSIFKEKQCLAGYRHNTYSKSIDRHMK